MAKYSSNALLFIIYLLLALFFTQIFLISSTITSLNSEKNGFSLQLLQSDYVLNPSLYANLTNEERIVRQFQSSYDLSVIQLPLKFQDNGFMVEIQIGFGNARQTYNLVADLSSYLTWTQCIPCNPSFPQTKPLYEPTRSRTFTTVNASSPQCRAPFFAYGNKCAYNIQYTHGNHVSGFLSRDVFTFQIASNNQTGTESLFFGCTHASYMDQTFSGKPAGIMGMNRARYSFAKQLAMTVPGRFSYCTFKSYTPNIGFLRFGSDIVVRGQMKTTPFKSGPLGEAYDLFLDGISLGNHRFDFGPRAFERTYINSTIFATLLVRPIYEAVKHALAVYFYSRAVVPVHVPELPLFEMCYTIPQNDVSVLPTMTWHLRGGDLVIQKQDLFMINVEKNYFCWAVMSDPEMTALGLFQQSDHRFIFDVEKNVLSFGQEDCAHDARVI